MGTSHKRLRPSFTFTEDQLGELATLVPEAFADGRVNWTVLREALGDRVENESEDSEHFGLSWPGKRAARRVAATAAEGSLEPVAQQGVDHETTRNVFIEGENLEVLKILLKSYAGHVKVIYIDPPYNTGNDFIYEDDFTEPLETYLRRTSQLGGGGEKLSTNTRADGRFHSKWLSMMYPRLRLARALLQDDGVLFVSIDDTEVAHLRLLLNEVFGEECFVECFVWKKSYGGGAKEKYVVRQHEYILMYCKSKDYLPSLWLPPNSDVEAKYYRFRDSKYVERGPYRVQPLEAAKSMDARPNLRFPITTPTGPLWPKRQWLWSKDRVEAALAADELVFTKSAKGESVGYKQYLKSESGEVRGAKPTSVLDGPYTQEGTKDLALLFGGEQPMQFTKPTKLLEKLLEIGAPPGTNSLVMDFFAGSCSFGQAVMELNRRDGGTRRMVCVQLPEAQIESGKWSTIAEIGKERLRRTVKALRKAAKPRENEDLGFRVYRLERSNFRKWTSYDGGSPRDLTELFEADPLRQDWTRDGLLTEAMLLEGFPLDARQELVADLKNAVIRVSSAHCLHSLFICFDDRVFAETVRALPLKSEDVFVCLEKALTDSQKVAVADRCLLKSV